MDICFINNYAAFGIKISRHRGVCQGIWMSFKEKLHKIYQKKVLYTHSNNFQLYDIVICHFYSKIILHRPKHSGRQKYGELEGLKDFYFPSQVSMLSC